MAPYPASLALMDPSRLRIEWSDGQARVYLISELRSRCPCASCREKRQAPPPPASALPVLSAAEARPIGLVQMSPVGNYAYSIKFNDGHDTGIFSFELLRELGHAAS